MKGLAAIVSSCAMLLIPAAGSAQNATLEVCNNGPVTVNVAYAARIQLFITGYKWKTTGWYVVDAGKCGVVYDEDYGDAGPYTPQSGARVVFAAIVGGAWRVYHDNKVQKSGWMQSGTGQICVKLSSSAGFKFDEPAGDPAANCSGGTLVPVAQDFMPDGPGKFTYTMDWDGDVSSVAVGKSPTSTTVARTKSAGPPVDSGNSESARFLRMIEQQERDSAQRANTKFNGDEWNADAQAAMLEWVQADLPAYLDASTTGFEVWLVETEGGGYDVHFQLVSAPTATRASK